MLALVDEAILLAGRGGYILGCVVVSLDRKGPVRRAARRVTPTRSFHWVNERPEVRRSMLQLAVAEGILLRGLVRRPAVRRDHEAIRALLLAELVGELFAAGVTELLIESRQEHNDAVDRRTIVTLAVSDGGRHELEYRHTGRHQEPLLWLADALAGAVSAQIRGEPSYTAALPPDRFVARFL